MENNGKQVRSGIFMAIWLFGVQKNVSFFGTARALRLCHGQSGTTRAVPAG
jgi:hypothetical protein